MSTNSLLDLLRWRGFVPRNSVPGGFGEAKNIDLVKKYPPGTEFRGTLSARRNKPILHFALFSKNRSKALT